MALWTVGLVVFLIGAAAATNSLVRRDLYVDPGGHVCTGGSVLDTCYGVNPSAFSPPPPDLSAYEPRGFGFVLPAQVAGGSVYIGDCHVVAIELNGRLSSRPEFRTMSALSDLRWALAAGILIVVVAVAVLAGAKGTSPGLKRTLNSAFVADVGIATVYGLLVVAFGPPLGPTVAGIVVILFVVAALLALGGLLFGVGSVVQLALVPAERDGLRIAGLQVGGAVAIAASLVLIGLHGLGTLWC